MNRISKFNLVHRFEKGSLLIAINCVAALSIFFFGYDRGVMGGVNTNRDYASLMDFGHWDETTKAVVTDNSLLRGGIVAVYYLPGTLLGALIGGWMGDKYGRIASIGIAAAWAVVGAMLQCSSQNHNWMLCGMFSCYSFSFHDWLTVKARVFNGIGTGILNAVTPVWATEMAEHTSRGRFVAIEFTLNIFGVVVAYWIEL